MRLKIQKSSKSTRLYVIKSTYDPKTGKTSSKVAAKLGSAEQIMKEKNFTYEQVIEWGHTQAAEMTRKDEEAHQAVTVRFHPNKQIALDQKRLLHIGHLFPRKILSELDFSHICENIASEYGFEYDLAEIAEYLVLGRILSPSSKMSTFEWCQTLIDPPKFLEHQMYRALSVLAEHTDEIQASLYKSSKKIYTRRTGILYFDCTNYFFEINEADEDGLRQYGVSKEHRPNPIVQMGLFMDADGVPLAFRLTPGNRNEQTTLKPLEQTIIDEFGTSKFVVCTDSGLSSQENRKFNTLCGRSFIVAQSLKKMKTYLQEWALDKSGWRLSEEDETIYDLREVNEVEYWDSVFYKERWVKEGEGDDAFVQRFIVTFSFKYMDYQASIREGQVSRAEAKAEKGASATKRRNPNDPARFLKEQHITKDGEQAKKTVVSLDEEKIAEEAKFDGFYCVATTLHDEPKDIIAVNKRRWQIEECFRVMKTEFKARPVYLSRQDRIKAHFLICFIALLVYRLLDKRLGGEFTCEKLLGTLQNMHMLELEGEGYLPAYTRDEVTDALHDAFGFRTDYEIVTNRAKRTVIAKSKSGKITK